MPPGIGPGRTLGRYELVSELAKGQLGALWACKSTTGEGNAQVVMMRRVPTSAPVTQSEIDHLSEGAWWAMELSHPTIAKTTDVVMTDGELGIVSEYVEGEVLRSLLRLASFKRKVVSVPIALRVVLDVIDAVSHSNDEAPPPDEKGGSVFGGLVPDSILVGTDGRARVLDAGIAGASAQVGPLSRHPEMTAYCAPEQLDGQTLDQRANLYSVGVMLWEMLAGKRLFVGSTQSAIAEKVKAGASARLDATKPIGGDAISAAVADVVQKAISPDAADRYQTAAELASALEAAASVASHEEVAAFVEDLAGNTLSTRRKALERATAGAAGPAAPVSVKTPGAPVLRPGATKPKPAAAPPPPDRTPAAAAGRKQTLLGIAPILTPDGRPKLESLDSSLLEVSDSEPPEVKSLTEEAKQQSALTDDASPKPPAATEGMSPVPPHSESPETVPRAGASPFDTPTLPPNEMASAALRASLADADEAGPADSSEMVDSLQLESIPPDSIEVDSLIPESIVPESVSADDSSSEPEAKPAEADAKPAGADAKLAAGKTDASPKPPPPKAKPADDSAVAWIGPPPGEALDEEDDVPPPIPSMRAEQGRKTVKYAMMALGALIVVGIGIAATRGGDETVDTPAETPAKTAEVKHPPVASTRLPRPPSPRRTPRTRRFRGETNT